MAVDRSLWTASFLEKRAPPWPCPECRSALFVVPGSFTVGEDVKSRKAHVLEEWDPEWIEERFSSMLQCSREACGQYVVLVGTARTQWDNDPDPPGSMAYERVFSPLLLLPMPALFAVPRACPEAIAHELQESFNLIWLDTASAGNRVRAALELLMDHVGMKKTALSSSRKRKRLPLHDRILLFRQRDQAMADSLLAVKRIGNSGSHPAGLSVTDLFDAYDILEHVLEELLSRRSRTLRRLVRSILRRRGPVAKPRGKRGGP